MGVAAVAGGKRGEDRGILEASDFPLRLSLSGLGPGLAAGEEEEQALEVFYDSLPTRKTWQPFSRKR